MHHTDKFKIIQVNDRQTITKFNDFPVSLYQNEKNWFQPITAEVEAIFDRVRNKHLANGAITRWILLGQQEITVGRIAAFFSKESAQSHEQPTGGIGFFDCINDQQAANILFDTAKEWLKLNGMEAMDGPTNPGMRDSFWGCLVDGFHEPVYNMPFNYSYYQELYENYGFKNYFNQYTYRRELEGGGQLHPVVRRTAERILKNPDYEFRLIEKGNKRYASDFKIIYNKAWDSFSGIKEISDSEALNLLKEMETILDERLVIYGYHKDEPIAFFIMMPDIGQITRKFKGRWNIWSKLCFMWHLKVTHSVDRVIGRIFGVIPEYQGKGIEGAMVIRFEEEVVKPRFPYKSLELNWIGDFNPVMMKVAGFIGGEIYKTHVTYRFIFDRTKEFMRAPMVNLPGKH